MGWFKWLWPDTLRTVRWSVLYNVPTNQLMSGCKDCLFSLNVLSQHSNLLQIYTSMHLICPHFTFLDDLALFCFFYTTVSFFHNAMDIFMYFKIHQINSKKVTVWVEQKMSWIVVLWKVKQESSMNKLKFSVPYYYYSTSGTSSLHACCDGGFQMTI